MQSEILIHIQLTGFNFRLSELRTHTLYSFRPKMIIL